MYCFLIQLVSATLSFVYQFFQSLTEIIYGNLAIKYCVVCFLYGINPG